ncbi:MAG: hypothetical protein GXO69_00555 [Acidobacteria bacterium]|nr:hypothetical protein [Acidobacteriota bacterium]
MKKIGNRPSSRPGSTSYLSRAGIPVIPILPLFVKGKNRQFGLTPTPEQFIAVNLPEAAEDIHATPAAGSFPSPEILVNYDGNGS